MRTRYLFIIGSMFIVVSGLIYTIERAVSNIAGNIKLAGFYAGRMTGEVPSPQIPGFSDNIFAPLFLLSGLIIIAVALLRSYNNSLRLFRRISMLKKYLSKYPLWFTVIWCLTALTILLTLLFWKNILITLFSVIVLEVANGFRTWNSNRTLSVLSFVLAFMFSYLFYRFLAL
ncbi:putative membrane protein [Paenibacillus rhizosphaerae]|uniref:Putative membrane protein n=1 Tax=Paenibacillus rhizosphaerae TaxID=297318 RepID=A0A839TJR0_9BACL|nr:putative membrane protein [Paenibacillus rhizosphaerae]